MKHALLILTLIGLHAVAQDKAMLDLSLEPPVINTKPGPEYDDQVRPGNMIIGIDRTPKGRLWAAGSAMATSPNGFFMLATSDDDGKTWSKPRVVIDPQDGELNGVRYERRALVGNLWTDPLGRLWCFFDQSLGYFDGRCGDWYIRCDDPDAAEPMWTKPVRFADGCTLNKPTVLSNGDWLLPVSLWTRDRIAGPGTDKEAHQDLDAIRMANVFASTDQGKTWTRRGGVAFPETDFDEHMIVERKDGSLWMLARTKDGISESTSTDKGATWSEPQPSAIQNPSARFFIRRLAIGKLLLVKNGPINVRLPRRSNLKAFLSDDDGKTWGKGLLIDDRAEVSYPDGFQAPDGTIHILYDWNRHTDAEILHVKFTEEDMLKQAESESSRWTRGDQTPGEGREDAREQGLRAASAEIHHARSEVDRAGRRGREAGFQEHPLRRRDAEQDGLRHHAARTARRLVDSLHPRRRRHRAFAAELHRRHAQHRQGQDVDAAGALRCRLPARRQDDRPGSDGTDDPRPAQHALLLHALEALGERLALVVSDQRRFLQDLEQAAGSAGPAEGAHLHPQAHRHARTAAS